MTKSPFETCSHALKEKKCKKKVARLIGLLQHGPHEASSQRKHAGGIGDRGWEMCPKYNMVNLGRCTISAQHHDDTCTAAQLFLVRGATVIRTHE